MAILFDIHLHTQRHSGCSVLDERHLIARAVKAGLDGIIITDHHYQWPEEELTELLEAANAPGFVLLSGFEYTSSRGDILIYGLDADAAECFEPFEDPKLVLKRAQEMGAFCIAAHPTREGLGFDEDILDMPFDAMEVCSVNLKTQERRLAQRLAEGLDIPGVAASDAHRLEDIGACRLAFEQPIRSIDDLRENLKCGRFRIEAEPGKGEKVI